jgi:hypothetical protein
MAENVDESTEVSTAAEEASKPNTGHDVDYGAVLNAAGSRDESEEIEGTFTVSDGNVVDESESRARVFADEKEFSPESEETINNSEVVAVTENGKEIQIVKHPKFAGFLVQFKEGGQVPAELGGTWTSYERALGAIRIYVAKRNGS